MEKRRGLCVVGVFLVSVLWAGSAQGAPKWFRLSWVEDPAHTITVSWTDGAGTGQGELRDAAGTVVATALAETTDTGSSTLGVTYTVTFRNLQPKTDYEYRVQSSGEWSEWHYAHTAPAAGSCEPFRVVMGGDGRGQELLSRYIVSHWPDVAALVAQESPLFVIHTGDYVFSGDNEDQWATELDALPVLSAEHAFFLTLGNHDTGPGEGDGAYYNSLFAYPADNPDGVEDYYTLVMGNLQIVCLSTETFNMDEQIAWLDSVLTAHESQVDWKIVFFHRPVWSSGNHGSNEDDKTRAEILLPVLEAHGVDLVINGHDHDYERFHPSIGGYGTPRQIHPLPEDNGTRGVADGVIYIVSGGYGALVDPTFSQSEEGSAFGSKHLHYVVADVNGPNMTLSVRDLGSQGLGSPSVQGDLEVIHLEKNGGLCAGGDQDGGTPDAGVWDSGELDGGELDGGELDGGGGQDGNAGGDGGTGADAGTGQVDAGTGGGSSAESGCGCRASGPQGGVAWGLFAVLWALVFVRRRRRRP